jgi:hypothetical protein
MEFLSRYDIKWQYKPGRTNIVDPISRNPMLAAAWAAALTRSRTGNLPKPTPQPAQQPDQNRRKRVCFAQAAEPEPIPIGEPEDDPPPDPDSELSAPILQGILGGYNTDPWLSEPGVRERFPRSDTGTG